MAGPYLERLAQQRKNPTRIAEAWANPRTLFAPVWQSRSLIIRTDEQVSACLLEGADALPGSTLEDCVLLGAFRGRSCFAAPVAEPHIASAHPAAEFSDLRAVAGLLSAEEAGVLGYARTLMHWRERRRYCGRCGAPTRAAEAGHLLLCSDPQCATSEFPRVDPAIIVLVTDGTRALLGRQSSWPAGRYSTIAGFVEPGESLEDAVIREVREETGVRVDDVVYRSSQPWPFPASLMIGFIAHASDPQMGARDDELEDVRWFSREEIARGEAAMPTPYSISFHLIEEWFDRESAVPLREQRGARLWSAVADSMRAPPRV